jgi:broad specificity phosphatase PhoE
MTRRLVFVRHGESTANADGSLTCAIPGVALTPRGATQAADLARDWPTDANGPGGPGGPGGPVRALWSSPMRRALETAEPLGARLGLPVRVHPQLFEFQIGDLHGRTDPESAELVRECFRRWQLHDELDVRPPSGESGAEIVARIRAALVDILAELPAGGTAIVVGHGTALRTGLSRLAAGLPPAYTAEHEVPNCGRIVVDAADPDNPDDPDHPWLVVRAGLPGGYPAEPVRRGAGTR